MALVIWLVVLWGSVYLITQSAIARPLRIAAARGSWIRAEFLYCPSCTGFWLGLALHSYWTEYVPTPLHAPFVSGLAALAAGRIWGRLFGDDTFETERPLLHLPGDT